MDLPTRIRDAVRSEKLLTSIHAQRRLRERSVEFWQIEAGVDEWGILEIRPDDLPNPSLVCLQSLIDGTRVKVVWSWYPEEEFAILVTVHFLEGFS